MIFGIWVRGLTHLAQFHSIDRAYDSHIAIQFAGPIRTLYSAFMKTNLIAVVALCVLGMNSSMANAEGMSRVVTDEHFAVGFYPGGNVKCRPGLASNGHNYPLYTNVSFQMSPYDYWGHAYFNSSHFNHRSVELGDFCSEYEHLTQMLPSQKVRALIDRKVTEGVHLAKQNGELKCLRSFREDMRVTIEGVQFEGVTIFDVGVTDSAHCE